MKTTKARGKKKPKKMDEVIEAFSALHLISDIGCEHVETKRGDWVHIGDLAAIIETTVGETAEVTHILERHEIRFFEDDKLALEHAHKSDGHVYPICGRTLVRLISGAIMGAEQHERRTWADIDDALQAGQVHGVPAGVDLEEFLWQTTPDSRKEIEARNPGRSFEEAPWAREAARGRSKPAKGRAKK